MSTAQKPVDKELEDLIKVVNDLEFGVFYDTEWGEPVCVFCNAHIEGELDHNADCFAPRIRGVLSAIQKEDKNEDH